MGKYSEDDKAEVLAAVKSNGGNINHTARQFGLAESTIRRFVEQSDSSETLRELREQKTENLGARLDGILDKLAKGLENETKIEAAKLNEVSTAFGTIFDKRQLLRGQPTSITQTKDAAKQALIDLRAKYPELSEEKARSIVAETFQVQESELVN